MITGTRAVRFWRAQEISSFFLQCDFISGGETYLVCNGSIAILKKSFKLTSWADSYPAKWPTEAKNYQKIKRDITVFCENLKWQKTEQTTVHANNPKWSLTDSIFVSFGCCYALKFKECFFFLRGQAHHLRFWQHIHSFYWQGHDDCLL